MSDEYAIATTAAEATLQEEIKKFVPAWAQDKIPASLIHEAATEIGKSVVDALNASA